jgi:hypothetical protein
LPRCNSSFVDNPLRDSNFDCADESFLAKRRSRRKYFMLEAIAAIVVVLGIGILTAHAGSQSYPAYSPA